MYVLRCEKAAVDVKISIFGNPDPFCDATVLYISPKWLKIHVKRNKTRSNDLADLQIGMGMFFGMKRPTVMSKFWNSEIWTLLWRHCPLNFLQMAQNSHKTQWNSTKWLFWSKIGMGMVFGLRKPMVMSKVRNSGIMTSFVTLLSSKFFPKWSKIQLKRNKIDQMIFFISKLV